MDDIQIKHAETVLNAAAEHYIKTIARSIFELDGGFNLMSADMAFSVAKPHTYRDSAVAVLAVRDLNKARRLFIQEWELLKRTNGPEVTIDVAVYH